LDSVVVLVPENGEYVADFFVQVVDVLPNKVNSLWLFDQATIQNLQQILLERVQEFN
jgi:hypothetical protein